MTNKKNLSGPHDFLIIDVGGTYIKSAIMSASGDIIKRSKTRTPGDYISFIALLQEQINKSNAKAVAIALPSVYNKVKNIVVATANIPYLQGRQLLHDLGYTNIPIFIENDANMAALGEYTKGFIFPPESLVFLTLGTGVGGGVFIGGQLLTGNITYTELGHMTLVAEGRLCHCGKRGCVEKYCTESAIIEDYIEGSGDKNTNSALYVAKKIEEGDFAAYTAFEMFALNLAHTIASLINIFNPDAVRIGGGLSELSKYYFSTTLNIVQNIIFPAFKGNADIGISALKNDAAFYGGAAWIKQNIACLR